MRTSFSARTRSTICAWFVCMLPLCLTLFSKALEVRAEKASPAKIKTKAVRVEVKKGKTGPTPKSPIERPRPKAAKRAPIFETSSDKVGYRIGVSVQSGARFTFNDPDNLLRLGESDGFYLRRGRLSFTGYAFDVSATISVDGAFDPRDDALSLSPAQRPFSMAVRDAFVRYNFGGTGAYAALGQMKVPFGRQAQRSALGEHFILFPLITVGEDIAFGYQVAPIIPGRDIGVEIGFERNFTRSFGMAFQVMLYNGNGANRFGNDSDYPAVAGRVEFNLLGRALKIGASGLLNPRRAGSDPEQLFDETDLSVGADISLYLGGFFMELEGALRMTSYPTSGQPEDQGLGGRLDLGYAIKLSYGRLEPVVRAEYYDPSSQFPDDELLYITIGINWFTRIWKTHQTGVRLTYTLKLELAESRALNNDQINLLLDYKW